jgi:hypothetical protein
MEGFLFSLKRKKQSKIKGDRKSKEKKNVY